MNVHADLKPMLLRENKAWMVSGYENFLYEVDLEAWNVRFVKSLQFKDNDSWRGNYAAFIYKNKVICIPDRNNKIAIYDMADDKLDYIDMPENGPERWNISAHILDEDILYLFSCTSNLIVKVDLSALSSEIYDCIRVEKRLNGVAYGKEFLFIAQEEELELYTYDIQNRTLQKEFVIKNIKKYTTLCCEDENIWFSGKRKNILCCNRKTNTIKEIDLSKFDIYEYIASPQKNKYYITEEEEFLEPLFGNQFIYGEYVWFVPYRSSHIIRVNKNDYHAEMIELPNEEESFESWSARTKGLNLFKVVFEFANNNGELVFYSYKNRIHYIVDADTGKVKQSMQTLKVKNMKEEIASLVEPDSIPTEGLYYNLSRFLELIKSV